MQERKDTLDFIVIGAQKAGTTSLFHYLREHPEISLPYSKEAPYFSHDRAYARGWAPYMSTLIPELDSDDPTRKWGTVTTHYMAGGMYQYNLRRARREKYDERTVPVRIRSRLPDVRLIALLRDPVARALSHHRMEASGGREARSFDDAVHELLRPNSLTNARRYPNESTGYVVWGEYGRILAGYLDVFPRQQLLVLFTNDLENEPAGLLSRLAAFIGVRTDFTPENLHTRYRVGTPAPAFSWRAPSSWMGPTSPIAPQALARALRRNPGARAVWHALTDEGQLRLRRPYEEFSRRATARWNRGSGSASIEPAGQPSTGALMSLREHYAADGELLAALLGEAPPWQTASAQGQAGHAARVANTHPR